MNVRIQCVVVVFVRRATLGCSPHAMAVVALLGARDLSGGELNGALCSMTLSRAGTLTFQSPPSSASAQMSVAGSVARQEKSRGPVGTP